MNALRFLLVMGVLAVAVSCAAQAPEVHQAARNGDCARLGELIDRSPELVNARDEGQDTPLHVAAMMGKMDAVLVLLARGAEADARNALDQSPLLYAAYNGYAAIVDTLIAHGAPFEYRDARGNAPIHFAARQGQRAVVELLVSKGASFDERGPQGKTPLHFAAANGHTEIVKLLASRGAKLDTRDDNGQTPLVSALSEGYVETAGLLLDAGCAIEGNADALARYVNRAAAAGGQRIVDALLAKGASLDAKDESGRTLLHNAAIGGLSGFAVRLLAGKANIDAIDNRGKTALHCAVAAGNRDIVDLLLVRGADPNVADSSGRTPLHVAEDAGRTDMTRILRAKGARDMERKTYRLGAESSGAHGKGGRAPLEITYFGNDGFLVSRGDKKAIIDVLFRTPLTPSIDDRVFEMMLEDRPPFDGIDLCVASHAHVDHLSPRMTAEFLKRNDGVVFISSPQACDSLRAAAGSDFGKIAGRVVSADPEWKKIEKLRKNGIDVAFFGVNHAPDGQKPYKTLATILDFDGIRLVHLADEIVALNLENFQAVDLARDGIDVAFADVMFLADSVGQYIMKEYIKPEHIILMHSPPEELDGAERRLMPLHPNLIIFRDQMEKKLFAYGQDTKVETGQIEDDPFRIQIPSGWNHNLVMYTHGYLARGDSWKPVGKSISTIFLGRGFAFAESGYSRQGWAVEEGIAETEALRRYFSKRYGRPDSTFVTGHSMGGLIALATIEKYRDSYDGALPMCGPLAPSLAYVGDRMFNMLVTFESLFGRSLPPARPSLATANGSCYIAWKPTDTATYRRFSRGKHSIGSGDGLRRGFVPSRARCVDPV